MVLSLRLAGRAEMIEIASLPKVAKITAMTPSSSPMAAHRASFAGTICADRKNSGPIIAKSIPCLTIFACRFGSSHTIIMI